MFAWFNLHIGALVVTAGLFGGMGFFAFMFTPMVFRFTEREDAGAFLRQVFPVYNRVMAATAVVPALMLLPAGTYTVELSILFAVALVFIFAAFVLIPRMNKARADENKKWFAALHRVSVIFHMAQFAAVTVVLVRLAQ